jgi:hypothetical protein
MLRTTPRTPSCPGECGAPRHDGRGETTHENPFSYPHPSTRDRSRITSGAWFGLSLESTLRLTLSFLLLFLGENTPHKGGGSIPVLFGPQHRVSKFSLLGQYIIFRISASLSPSHASHRKSVCSTSSLSPQ